MALYKLVFDITSTATQNDSANVGAYIRSSDGTLLDKTVVGAKNALTVFSATADGVGTAITSTTVSAKQALDVNMVNTLAVDINGVYNVSTNPAPDTVGAIVHVRGAAPDATAQTVRTTGAAATSSGVTAANVFGIDVNSFNMGYNGTTWDRITSTSGAMNVNVSSTTGTLTVSDAAIANTAILGSATSVTTTAAAAPATALSARKYIGIQNRGNRSVYIGATGVTSASGYELAAGSEQWLRLGPAVSVFAISASGTQDIRTLEMS